LLLPLDIELEEVEAEMVNEEKEDRRQVLMTDGLGRGFPRSGSPLIKSSRDWRAEGKAPVSAGRSPFEGDICTKWCIRKVVLARQPKYIVFFRWA
jgi:hypothetical protein